MRQLSGQDASFIYLDSQHGDTHGTLVLVYDASTAARQPIRFKDILGRIRERLGHSRLFRQRLLNVPLSLDYPYWVDDPGFDIEYHIRHVAVPKPGDWRQFCILASSLHATPIDLRRPPWEMFVVEGLDNVDWLPKGSFAILLKAHHCALDGHTAAELTMALHDLDAAGLKPAPVQATAADAAPPRLRDMVAGIWRNTLITPMKAVRPALHAVPRLGAALTRFVAEARRDPARRVLTRFNRPLSPHRVFTARGFALADVKTLRQAVPGATINDAVLSVASGALRHYLQAKNELPRSGLRVTMPINTRSQAEFGEGGNFISMMFAEAHVNIADPIKRLAAVHKSTRNAKEMSEAIGAREMTDITRYSPVAVNLLAMKLFARSRGGSAAGAPLAHFGMSNVPGPAVPLFLCGAELKYWSVIAPMPQGFGLVFGISSYRDRLFISPTADRAAMPDPELFEQCIERSFAEHLAGAEQTLARHPELLAGAAQPQPGRRAHPGLAAMARVSGGNAGADAAVKSNGTVKTKARAAGEPRTAKGKAKARANAKVGAGRTAPAGRTGQ